MTPDLSTRLRTLGEAGEDSPPPTDDLIRRGRHKLRTRRVSAAGAVLTVAVVATGWALTGHQPSHQPSPQPGTQQGPAAVAAPVSLALAAQTSEQVPYRLTMHIGYQGTDARPVTFEGGYDPATGNAFIRDAANLKFSEERQVGGYCWVDSGGSWRREKGLCFSGGVGGKVGFVRDPKGLLDELKAAGDTTYAGRSNGVDSWKFTSEDRRELATLHYAGTVKVDVATSRVLSVEFTESIPGETVTSLTTVSYHDYGKPVVVTAP
ncbi:hypothetical protein [Hamadaea tsunoensis]|uniref:hypothetical protein n=1 Tax=Hamadaea tsunoensis TaxID=53368 RepID=UPI000416F28B|nr:hypothetical protein [Hamadaea tsunoensis]